MAFNRTEAVRAAREHLDGHLLAIDDLQKKIVALHDPDDSAGRAKLNSSFADLKAKHAEFTDDCCAIVGSVERPKGH